MDRIQLPVRLREGTGKGAARKLRAAGEIPGVVYGRGEEAVSLAIPTADMREALLKGGPNVLLELHFGKDMRKRHYAVVKELQVHPTRRTIMHVDLHEVSLDEQIESVVEVRLLGEPAGVKAGGILDHPHRELHVRSLPTNTPDHLELDVTGLDVGDHCYVRDIEAPEGVVILDEPDLVLASVLPPRLPSGAGPEEEAPEEEVSETEE